MNNNQGLSIEIITALIGVGGTIIGTIIGWILNNISHSGWLHFYSQISGLATKYDGYGGYMGCEKLNDSDQYTCFIDLDIYNKRADYRTVKDLQVQFCYNRKHGFSKKPLVKKSKNDTKYETVDIINIPPKQTISLYLSVSLKKELFPDLERVNTVRLKYKNEKNKTKTVSITNHFIITETD